MYRIMVVDDEQLAAKSNKFILTNNLNDIEVETAFSGKSALSKIEGFNPDIILMDLHMPNISGIEVMEKIRAQNIKVIIIVLSGSDCIECLTKCQSLYVYEYLVKPVNKSILLNTIQNAIKSIEFDKKDYIDN